MSNQQQMYDVAIIGSGIAGSSLGAILARQGLKVIILEAQSHPKFAIGESMILETSESMRAAAELYDVPELANFSSENYFARIGTSHGVKRHFSFLHHVENQPQDKAHTLQAVIPREPHGHELHLYRQDSDYYLTAIAIAYGATVLQNTPVADVQLLPDRVEVVTQKGETFRAQYVVDAGGFRSLLAECFQLRDTTLQTYSRGVFTHMINVPDYHAVAGSRQEYGLPYSVAEGTLHHVFHGGWMWVIPFNNHKRATNPLCSVGLMLDPRIYPLRSDVTPEQEFFDFVARFPSMSAQFAHAHAVRDWTRSGRISYSAKHVVGDRFALLGHAAGFIDPLYSKGLYITYMTLAVLADLLLAAHVDGDYSAARFQPLETLTQAYVRTNDRLVANSYKSFSNYKLWSCYSVMWLLGAYTELVKLFSIRTQACNRRQYFDEAYKLKLAGGGFPEFELLNNQIDEIIEATDPFDETAVDRAVAEMQAHFGAINWMPPPFQELLAGSRNHLPTRKISLRLFKKDAGFLGAGAFRQHFFGDSNMSSVVRAFLREKALYSVTSLKLQHHFTQGVTRPVGQG